MKEGAQVVFRLPCSLGPLLQGEGYLQGAFPVRVSQGSGGKKSLSAGLCGLPRLLSIPVLTSSPRKRRGATGRERKIEGDRVRRVCCFKTGGEYL